MSNPIGRITTNRITGAKIVERPKATTSFTPTIHKRNITGNLKPDELPVQTEAEAEIKSEIKSETKEDTAARLGADGEVEENDDFNTQDNDDYNSDSDGFNSNDDDDDDDDDGFNGNLDDNGSDDEQDAHLKEFTSENNVYYDGHGYARRVGKENDCYIEFSVDENILVINQIICPEGGKLLLYHMIKDLQEKGYDFTYIRLIAANLNPNPFDPKLFDEVKFNQQNFEKNNPIFIEMQAKNYIDENGEFTEKYHNMMRDRYVVKYIYKKGKQKGKVKYIYTPKYYRHMQQKVVGNYENMGFEKYDEDSFIGSKEYILAALETFIGDDKIIGGSKKRKTKRKTNHYKKTKRKPKYNKKTKRKTQHYKKTKRKTKK
jgi:hypothetical protein